MPRNDNPTFIPTTGPEDWAERLNNALSFTDIPHDQLPWRSQLTWRAVLLALQIRALSGYDCYAYRPAYQRQWVIWDRQPDLETESRCTPHAWAIKHGYQVDELAAEDEGTPPQGGDAA